MKKLLIIALLVVGCEEDTPTESSVHPLVGVWEGIEHSETYLSQTTTVEHNENTYVNIMCGEDGIIYSVIATSIEITAKSGTWSATGNKLTIIYTYIEDDNTEIYNYSISGKILTMHQEIIIDGEPWVYEVKLQNTN